MKMEKATRDQIVRNVIVSLFIYLLPIVAMFLTLYITGQRPWEKKKQAIENVKPSIIKNSQNNGSND